MAILRTHSPSNLRCQTERLTNRGRPGSVTSNDYLRAVTTTSFEHAADVITRMFCHPKASLEAYNRSDKGSGRR